MWMGIEVSAWDIMARAAEEIVSHVLRRVIIVLTFAMPFWGWNNERRVTHGDLSRRLRAKGIATYSPGP